MAMRAARLSSAARISRLKARPRTKRHSQDHQELTPSPADDGPARLGENYMGTTS